MVRFVETSISISRKREVSQIYSLKSQITIGCVIERLHFSMHIGMCNWNKPICL